MESEASVSSLFAHRATQAFTTGDKLRGRPAGPVVRTRGAIATNLNCYLEEHSTIPFRLTRDDLLLTDTVCQQYVDEYATLPDDLSEAALEGELELQYDTLVHGLGFQVDEQGQVVAAPHR